MSQDDRELIVRLQRGDLEALGALYDRYRLLVYRTALAITRDGDAAEDITHDTFLRLNAYAGRINHNLPLPPWLYRITANLSYTWVTRRSRRRAPLDEFLDRLVGPLHNSPEPRAERADALRAVQAGLDALPVNQRIVLVLYYLNDLSLQDIAGILEVPVGTVKSRLHYGRENLRRWLASTPGAPEVAYEFT